MSIQLIFLNKNKYTKYLFNVLFVKIFFQIYIQSLINTQNWFDYLTNNLQSRFIYKTILQ